MKIYLSNLLLFTFCLFMSSKTLGQQCGFDEVRSYLMAQDSTYYRQQEQANINWWKHWRNTHPSNYDYKPYNGVESRSNCPKARIIIPVVVHVIHNGGAENISLAQAQNAIDAMNNQYANVLVQAIRWQ